LNGASVWLGEGNLGDCGLSPLANDTERNGSVTAQSNKELKFPLADDRMFVVVLLMTSWFPSRVGSAALWSIRLRVRKPQFAFAAEPGNFNLSASSVVIFPNACWNRYPVQQTAAVFVELLGFLLQSGNLASPSQLRNLSDNSAPALSVWRETGRRIPALEFHACHFRGAHGFCFASWSTISLAAYREIKP
jgi:hypothetical protein